jgi:hypothetical protein
MADIPYPVKIARPWSAVSRTAPAIACRLRAMRFVRQV